MHRANNQMCRKTHGEDAFVADWQRLVALRLGVKAVCAPIACTVVVRRLGAPTCWTEALCELTSATETRSLYNDGLSDSSH
jgi:hypothetical protein